MQSFTKSNRNSHLSLFFALTSITFFWSSSPRFHGFCANFLLSYNLQVLLSFCWVWSKRNRDRIKMLRNLRLQWQSTVLDDSCIPELKEHHYCTSWSTYSICFTELGLNTSGIHHCSSRRSSFDYHHLLNCVVDIVDCSS